MTLGHKELAMVGTEALEVLEKLGLSLETAIRMVQARARYWGRLRTGIEVAKSDPERFFKDQGVPKVGVVRKFRKEWKDMEGSYASYEYAVSRREVLPGSSAYGKAPCQAVESKQLLELRLEETETSGSALQSQSHTQVASVTPTIVVTAEP